MGEYARGARHPRQVYKVQVVPRGHDVFEDSGFFAQLGRVPGEAEAVAVKGFEALLAVEALPPVEPVEEAPSIDQVDYGKKTAYRTNAPLLASQVMSRGIQTLHMMDTLEAAWNLISRKRFRHVPIINEKGYLVGVLSDRKLSRELLNRGKLDADEVMNLPIEEIMVCQVMTAQPETALAEIAEMFVKERIGCMPIINNKHQLVGMLTRSDILRTMINVGPKDLRV